MAPTERHYRLPLVAESASMSSSFESLEANLGTEAGLETDLLLGKVRLLRSEIVTAWRERAVILSKYEQKQLRQEIIKTCELLSNLTRTH